MERDTGPFRIEDEEEPDLGPTSEIEVVEGASSSAEDSEDYSPNVKIFIDKDYSGALWVPERDLLENMSVDQLVLYWSDPYAPIEVPAHVVAQLKAKAHSQLGYLNKKRR